MDFSFSKQVTLKDGRVVELRYPRADDAQLLLDYINPIIAEPARILVNTQQTLEDEQKYVEMLLRKMEKDEFIKVLVVAEGKIVGSADVHRLPYKQSHMGSFGLSVAKDYRGSGLGRILTEEMLRQAKEVLKVEMVELTCNLENEPAHALYQKVGFVEYGRLPRAIIHDGNYETQLLMYKVL